MEDVDSCCRKFRLDLFVEVAPLFPQHGQRAGAQGGKGFCRGLAVRGPAGHASGQLILQPRYANHKELIEIGAEDRQELDAFEQRVARVVCFIQHATIELKPAQLAVQIQGRMAGHAFWRCRYVLRDGLWERICLDYHRFTPGHLAKGQDCLMI